MPDHVAPSGPSAPCAGEYCRLCQLLDRDGPHYNEHYRRLFFPGEFPAPEAAPTAHAEAPTPAPLAPSTASRPLAEVLALQAKISACPWRDVRPDCGCSTSRCAAGLGDRGLVTFRDCLDCVEADQISGP